MLKGREIEEELRNRGFEAGTRYILREQQETLYALFMQQKEIAETLMKLMEAVTAVAGGYQGLRTQVERITRNAQSETQSE